MRWIVPSLAAFFLFALPAFADGLNNSFLLSADGMVNSHTTTTGTAGSTSTDYLNLQFGYAFDSGLYLGGTYTLNKQTANPTATLTAYGASLGYFSNPFHLIGTYFLSSNYNVTSLQSSYTGGSAYMFEVGWDYMLASWFYVSLDLVYDSFNWNSYKVGSTTTSTTNAMSDTYPALGLRIVF